MTEFSKLLIAVVTIALFTVWIVFAIWAMTLELQTTVSTKSKNSWRSNKTRTFGIVLIVCAVSLVLLGLCSAEQQYQNQYGCSPNCETVNVSRVDYYLSVFAPEFVGIGLVVLLIDWLYRKVGNEREKHFLILQVARSDNETAKSAILTLFANTWLQDGSLSGQCFVNAELQDAYLVDANLDRTLFLGANLRSARLINASLKYAKLQGADLRGAFILGANFYKAKLWDAKLEDVVYDDETVPPFAGFDFKQQGGVHIKEYLSAFANTMTEIREQGEGKFGQL